jgi:hypothetical protein
MAGSAMYGSDYAPMDDSCAMPNLCIEYIERGWEGVTHGQTEFPEEISTRERESLKAFLREFAKRSFHGAALGEFGRVAVRRYCVGAFPVPSCSALDNPPESVEIRPPQELGDLIDEMYPK